MQNIIAIKEIITKKNYLLYYYENIIIYVNRKSL